MKGSVPNHIPPNERWVHVDINSYFATMIQQENPRLRGVPLGVVKDAGRTCVIACSKEAKALGVRTGSRAEEARHLAPHIQFIPAEFELYWDATKKLRRVFESLAPDVEIFSLDEAFINLTSCNRLYPDAQEFGRTVQQRIHAELGEWVTASIGIGPNRFLAKMAGETATTNQVLEVTPENLDDFLATTSFQDVCGIGHRLERRLQRLGVRCPYDINFIPDEDLQTTFGPFWSKELRKMGRGEEPHFLAQKGSAATRTPPVKSVSRSITGFQLCHDEDTIQQVLWNLSSEVMTKIRRMQLTGRHISVGLYGHDRAWHQHRTLRTPIWHLSDFFQIAYHELYGSWHREFPIIRFRVALSLLQPQRHTTPPLWPEWEKEERIEQATDALNEKYGLFTVRSGLLTKTPIIRPEVTGFLGDKTYQFAHQ